jgi:hypothetical protein
MKDVLKLALAKPLPRAPRKAAKRDLEREVGFFEYMKKTSTAH